MKKIVLKSTESLKLHPALKRVTLMPDVVRHLKRLKVKKQPHREAATELSEDLAAFYGDLDANGILEPLKVVGDTIYDGRNRWRWAMERGVKEVPCMEVTDNEGKALIEGTVIARRFWNKSMRAYFAVLLHPEVVDNKAGGDRQSGKHSNSVGMLSRGELAKRFGVSDELINQACKLYAKCDSSRSHKEKFEPFVWTGLFGLGAIIAGTAGYEATSEKAIRPSNKANGLLRRFGAFGGAVAETWPTLTNEDDQAVVLDGADYFATKLPTEVQDRMWKTLGELREARSQQS